MNQVRGVGRSGIPGHHARKVGRMDDPYSCACEIHGNIRVHVLQPFMDDVMSICRLCEKSKMLKVKTRPHFPQNELIEGFISKIGSRVCHWNPISRPI